MVEISIGFDSANLECHELVETGNLNLDNYQPDPDLQEKIRPYAELADAVLDLPIGELTGDWDGSKEFFTAQSNTVDLPSAAMMAIGTERMQEKFGVSGLEALQYYGGRITTRSLEPSSLYLFNFYEIVDEIAE